MSDADGGDGDTVVVSGATGLVGGRLLPALVSRGEQVRALTRSPGALPPSGAPALRSVEPTGWDGTAPPRAALEGALAIVHLAGEPVFGGAPSRARRERIRASRVESTLAIARRLGEIPHSARPSTLICASAVGYYGDPADHDAELDESTPRGTGFLAEVCGEWEEAARGACQHGVRVVSLRIGLVLAREGGALGMMLPVFRLGLGGRLGNGRQWMPWVGIDDLVQLVLFALDEATLSGPVNAVAPQSVSNADFTRALGSALRRPTLFAVPQFAIRAALGELAGELLGSRRVVPAAATHAGFRFECPSISSLLARELEP